MLLVCPWFSLNIHIDWQFWVIIIIVFLLPQQGLDCVLAGLELTETTYTSALMPVLIPLQQECFDFYFFLKRDLMFLKQKGVELTMAVQACNTGLKETERGGRRI